VLFLSHYDQFWGYGKHVSSGRKAYFLKCLVHDPQLPPLSREQIKQAILQTHNAEYFDAYNNYWIHHLMLSDAPRTLAYKDAILTAARAGLLEGKIVLDIGCGSGILSAFCALAGAKHVYGIDASKISDVALAVIKENQLEDKITIIHGNLEDVQLPIEPGSVDVIVSEWMGHFLVCESMTKTVLIGRDRYLKKEGLMLPSSATLFLAPISIDELYQSKVGFLDDVSGIDMSRWKKRAITKLKNEMIIHSIDPQAVMTQPVEILKLDMYTASPKDLESFSAQFSFKTDKSFNFHGFTAWFDCFFDIEGESKTCVLSTSPFNELTHWVHTNFLYSEDPVELKNGQEIKGRIEVRIDDTWTRQFKVTVTSSVSGQERKASFNL